MIFQNPEYGGLPHGKKDHTDYLHEQESHVQLLSFYDGEEDGPGGYIPDLFANSEEQAMASIVRKALSDALSSLDKESHMIIDDLILAHDRKSERDFASEFGISQNAVHKRKEKIDIPGCQSGKKSAIEK